MKKLILIRSVIIFLFFSSALFAAENEEGDKERQYKLQRYDVIKKEQKKEFKKGVYNDTKKDYVNDWIGQDINYQKKTIKLKKEYREWVIDKIENKQKVRFKDYEPLKSMTRVEKQILYEYHNMLFEKQVKQKPDIRRKKRIKQSLEVKAPVVNNTDTPVESDKTTPAIPEEMSDNNIDSNYFPFLLPGIAGILIILSAFLLIKKFKKQKT